MTIEPDKVKWNGKQSRVDSTILDATKGSVLSTGIFLTIT